MSIKTILVATDFSENAQVAFERASDLALQLGAKLHLLHSQDESALRVAIKEGLLDMTQTDEELGKAVEALSEKRFAKLLSGIHGSGVEVEHLSRRGDSGKLIVGYAREINADLVVVGRRGANMVKEILSAVVGSVAGSVIRRSPCPVLVVRHDHKKK